MTTATRAKKLGSGTNGPVTCITRIQHRRLFTGTHEISAHSSHQIVDVDRRNMYACGDAYGKIEVFDQGSNTSVGVCVGGHDGAINCIVQISNDKFATSSDADKHIIIWDMKDFTPFQSLEHERKVTALTCSERNGAVIVGSPEGVISVYEFSRFTHDYRHALDITSQNDGDYRKLTMCQPRDILLSASSNINGVKLWKVGYPTLESLRTVDYPEYTQPPTCIAITNNYHVIYATKTDISIFSLFDPLNGHTRVALSPVDANCIATDTTTLIAISCTNGIAFINRTRDAVSHFVDMPHQTVRPICYVGYGKIACGGFEDGEIKIINIQ